MQRKSNVNRKYVLFERFHSLNTLSSIVRTIKILKQKKITSFLCIICHLPLMIRLLAIVYVDLPTKYSKFMADMCNIKFSSVHVKNRELIGWPFMDGYMNKKNEFITFGQCVADVNVPDFKCFHFIIANAFHLFALPKTSHMLCILCTVSLKCRVSLAFSSSVPCICFNS